MSRIFKDLSLTLTCPHCHQALTADASKIKAGERCPDRVQVFCNEYNCPENGKRYWFTPPEKMLEEVTDEPV